jgi:DNA helicase-2/ATP-dependent DNA helicase PcrA
MDENLNSQQKEAIKHIQGPALVIAGAGSGKTRVVTYRIVELLQNGVHPSQILGLTFTNKAAGEMKERVQQLTQRYVLICTFHSLGARILRESISNLGFRSDFTIYDDEDSDKLLKTCLADVPIFGKAAEIKVVRNLISRAKNDLLAPGDIDTRGLITQAEQAFPQAYALYQERLRESNAVDFDDLLYLTVQLLRDYPTILEMYHERWRYLLIDEYQDTNTTQYNLVKFLAGPSRNIFVVGDPDQSIYSWRGATIGNILNFEQDYPGAKVIRLEQNYRSKGNILHAANGLIQFNHKRIHKELWSSLGAGETIKDFTARDGYEEARFVGERIRHHQEHDQIPLNEMAIFYRTNAQSRAFEDYFLVRRIPYIIIGGISFYQRREVKDILAFLRMVYSSNDIVALLRTINLPKRGIGPTTLDKIQTAALEEKLPIFEFIVQILSGKLADTSLKLSKKQVEALKNYIDIILKLREIASHGSLKDLVACAIKETNYQDVLKEDKETYVERLGNVNELISKAAEWQMVAEDPSLGGFLTELSLKSSLDETSSEQKECVRLMTLHNGKGLEFRSVFLVGMEEDLLPHINSKDDTQALEEERRLCYVGITRAKEFLYLTRAMVRLLWGSERAMRPSRFLMEIPKDHRETLREKSSFSPKPYRFSKDFTWK